MDNKNLLSALVAAQFPEFVREDYPAFVQFIELYYKFLEVEKGPQNVLSNLLSYTDLDRTLNEFVSRFEATYIDSLPPVIAADRRLLLKHVMDLYQSKGNQESYKMLFRLLFNEEIELYFPKQQILRVSDGRWTQKQSIKVRVSTGSALDSVNKSIKITTANGVINTFIKDVVVQSDGVVELYIDKTFGLKISAGDMIAGLGFTAQVLATTAKVRVLSGGAGFTVGQVFDIESVSGTGTRIKVTEVNGNGGIRRASIIRFGDGYKTDFQINIAPNSKLSGVVDSKKDYTNGFIEQVSVTRVTYFLNDYVDLTYSGELIGDAYSNEYYPDNVVEETVSPAILAFSVGGICSYHGEYTASDGFLSDVNKVQDGHYYQDFSYVIKTKRSLEEYSGIVKKLLHPAGTAMFAEVQQEIELELGEFFEYQKVLSAQFNISDFVDVVDVIRSLIQGKALFDTVTGVDAIMKAITTLRADTVSTFDELEYATSKGGNNDTSTVTEQLALSMTKLLADTVATSDLLQMQTGSGDSETLNVSETMKLNTTKGRSDTAIVAEAGIVLANDYMEVDYSTADYAGTTLSTF